MLARYTFFVSCCLLFAGCTSSVRVYRAPSASPIDKAGQVPGIPFYVKVGVCKQQTVWLEPTYEVKTKTDILATLSHSGYKYWIEHNLSSEELPKAPRPAIIDESLASKDKEKLASLISDQEKSGDWQRVANTASVEAAVDYGQTYYLNSARPLAGSSQVTAKLAPDGTLTDVSGQVQDQTLSTIVGAVSSLTSSAASLMGFYKEHTDYQINVRAYTHTHVQYSRASRLEDCKLEPGGVLGGSYTVAEQVKAADKDAAKDRTVSISGTIVLPQGGLASAPPTSPPK